MSRAQSWATAFSRPSASRTVYPLDGVVADIQRIGAVRQHLDPRVGAVPAVGVVHDTNPVLALGALLDVFEAISTIQEEIGEAAADTYIISMCHGADDMLRVALLGKERGLLDLTGDNPTSNINFNPVVEFDGLSNGVSFGDQHVFSNNNGLAVIAVAAPEATGASKFVFDFGFNATWGYGLSFSQNSLHTYSATGAGGASRVVSHANGATPAMSRPVNAPGSATSPTTFVRSICGISATRVASATM